MKKNEFFFAHKRKKHGQKKKHKNSTPQKLTLLPFLRPKNTYYSRNTLKYKALDLCIKNSYIIFNYKKKEVSSIAYS